MKIRLLFSLFAMMTLFAVRAQITTVGLIGSATPYGWDADTSMVQDAVNPDLWTLEVLLVPGEAKFRANDDWAINWGDVAFPIGVGTANGPNIPIVSGGLHTVTFNSATGEYYFSVASDIGIIGSATPTGWDADVNLYQDPGNPDLYAISMGLVAGEAKFRQDDDWAVNWGSTDFPSGVGTQNGPNIPVSPGGDYNITFNKATGEYNFTLTSFSTVGLIGDATPGGWDTPTAMNSGSTLGSWTVNVVLVDGGVQFSGDNGVAVWGGTDFPSGTAALGGDTIPVPAGRYQVNFNSRTLAYEFVPVVYYQTVGIIGDATPGGWDTDTDMELNPLGDSTDWQLRVILTDGELKFRADNDWAVNWGAPDFPTGVALRDGPNIPVTAGEYNIYFSSFLGNYGFVEIRVFSSMGLIGTATPFGDWATDAPMEKDANNENLWKIQSIDLVDGEAKFRAEGAWTTNWGAADFPAGIGTQDGPNILVLAGTYGVTLNSESGEYAFGDPLVGTKDVLDPGTIQLYPNPAKDEIHLDLSSLELRGQVTLNVFDINGKLVFSEIQQGNDQMKLGVASLQNGFYTLQITNDKYIIGKKFSIMK
jgi:Secretion system C-terminal sorting domain/Outer membrane protein SusF_SusE